MTSIIRADNISTVAGTGTISVQAGNTLDASAGFTAPAGHVIQVVTGYSTTFLQKDSGDGWVATGIKATITPSSTSSKIVVLGTINGTGTNAGSCRINLRLYRNSSSIADVYDGLHSVNDVRNISTSVDYEDSPSSTSALEYEFYFDVDNSGSAFINNYANSQNTRSQITLMEIAG